MGLGGFMLNSIIFEGTASGDGEEFCWDVTLKEFERVMKRKPYTNEKINTKSARIYPYAILAYTLDADMENKNRFAIFVEPIKEKNL